MAFVLDLTPHTTSSITVHHRRMGTRAHAVLSQPTTHPPNQPTCQPQLLPSSRASLTSITRPSRPFPPPALQTPRTTKCETSESHCVQKHSEGARSPPPSPMLSSIIRRLHVPKKSPLSSPESATRGMLKTKRSPLASPESGARRVRLPKKTSPLASPDGGTRKIATGLLAIAKGN